MTHDIQLRGRDVECAVIASKVDLARSRQSAVLVLQGEAGSGKTALLDHAVGRAAELRVLKVGGVESEMELPFAGLHQLCGPLLGDLEHVPAPQADALAVGLGQRAGMPPERFLVGLAVLGLLSHSAERWPLLIVVDDAQWLDLGTRQTLGFVARRMGAEPIAMLIAARDVGQELHGLDQLSIGGLPEPDARTLLREVIGVVDERIQRRILDETGGNPLALLQLPRQLTATQLAGGFGPLSLEPLPARIEASFLREAEHLPPSTRQLLLLAAADSVGDRATVWRAAEYLGLETSVDEIQGLLTVGDRLTFRHPLVRSALYRSASPAERRTVHGALADALDGTTDPDRRAWHRSAAAAGPDEEVAHELERSAGRAQARGGFAAAAAFLGRSVDLTVDPQLRADRALSAARAALSAGVFGVAHELIATAERSADDELRRATADLLRAQLAFAQKRGSEAPALLLRAARTLEPLDPRLARDTYLDAWGAALFAGDMATAGNFREIAQAVRTAAQPEVPLRASDQLLDGLTRLFTDTPHEAVPLLQSAVAAYSGDELAPEEVMRWGWLATVAGAIVWDFDGCMATARRQVEVARAAGALNALTVAVNELCQAMSVGGEFAEAASLTAEADAVRDATGAQVADFGALVLLALRGNLESALPLIEATIAAATAEGQGVAVQYAHWSRAVLYNACGRYDEALVSARMATDELPELFVSGWALVELVEAAAKAGHGAAAEEAYRRLAERTSLTRTPWGRGVEARARGLVSEDDEAEAGFVDAIAAFGGSPLRPDLARSHLVYGEWLRSQDRIADARTQLRTAQELATAIGMTGFGERARVGREATGETVRQPRAAEVADVRLTPQEWQIARLVQDGLSNAEVGARLFLSTRTIEWHLRKVFSKLAITSRRQLRDALVNVADEAVG